ncbi:hypothetical protein ACFQX6_55645 [Streptosporangium lutulentum]
MLRHGDGYLVVLTDLADDDLGIGIRAHLVNEGRLLTLRPWDMLKQSFEARTSTPCCWTRDGPPGRWPAGSPPTAGRRPRRDAHPRPCSRPPRLGRVR